MNDSEADLLRRVGNSKWSQSYGFHSRLGQDRTGHNSLVDCKKEILKYLQISQRLERIELAVNFLHLNHFSIEWTYQVRCTLPYFICSIKPLKALKLSAKSSGVV